MDVYLVYLIDGTKLMTLSIEKNGKDYFFYGLSLMTKFDDIITDFVKEEKIKYYVIEDKILYIELRQLEIGDIFIE